MSKSELARRVGVSRATIGYYLRALSTDVQEAAGPGALAARVADSQTALAEDIATYQGILSSEIERLRSLPATPQTLRAIATGVDSAVRLLRLRAELLGALTQKRDGGSINVYMSRLEAVMHTAIAVDPLIGHAGSAAQLVHPDEASETRDDDAGQLPRPSGVRPPMTDARERPPAPTPTPMADPVAFAVGILGVRPHAKQAAFLRDAHPVKVLVGGRRAGKSLVIAVEAVHRTVRGVFGGQPTKQLVVAPTTDQGRLLVQLIARLLRTSALGGLVAREVSAPYPELQVVDGSELLVRSAHDGARNLRGHAADRVFVDEAAYVEDSVITEVLLPMLADTDGQLVLASTPAGRSGLFHMYVSRGLGGDPRIQAFHVRTLENPHVSAAFVEAQRADLTAEQFAREYDGEFADAQGTVFQWSHVAACAVGHVESARPRRRYVLGFDPAKLRDRSAVVVLDVTETPARVVHLADFAQVDYTEQANRAAALAHTYRAERCFLDATGVGEPMHDLLRQHGVVVSPVRFSSRRKADLVQGLAVAVERRRVIFPPHAGLLDEFRWYRATATPSGSMSFGATGSATDDYITALSLAVTAISDRTGPFLVAGVQPFFTRDYERRTPVGVLAVPKGSDPVDAWFAQLDDGEDAPFILPTRHE